MTDLELIFTMTKDKKITGDKQEVATAFDSLKRHYCSS